jgi:hypothetical protein
VFEVLRESAEKMRNRKPYTVEEIKARVKGSTFLKMLKEAQEKGGSLNDEEE